MKKNNIHFKTNMRNADHVDSWRWNGQMESCTGMPGASCGDGNVDTGTLKDNLGSWVELSSKCPWLCRGEECSREGMGEDSSILWVGITT